MITPRRNFACAIAVLVPFVASAQTGKFGQITPFPGDNGEATIQVDYVTSPPGGVTPYLFPATASTPSGPALPNPWSVYWQRTSADPSTKAKISRVADSEGRRLVITLIDAPTDLNLNQYFWTVTFTPPEGSGLAPQLFPYKPLNPAPPTAGPSTPAPVSKKSCDNTSPATRPYLCPPSGAAPADISITGAFLAAGGTKPIYQLSATANYYLPKDSVGPSNAHNLWNFDPGINLGVQINQNTKPPNNRTRFDPDSITATLDFQRLVTFEDSFLTGIQFDEGLPGGEFSRSDPSSNLIFKSSALFALRPWKPAKSVYATIYPVLSFEGGKNLNRPGTLAKTPIDLSRYNAIARGVVGAEGTLGFVSADRKTDNVTLTASYRARIPMFDEPFIMTQHGITTVSLTTKTRNWVEVVLNISPSSFKYLALTVQYQYGELPPVFNFVDHKVSVGLTLKAVQTNKPTLPSAVK